MAKIVRSTPVGKKKVYDVTVSETHSFFAYSRDGDSRHAILAHNCHELSRQAMDAMLKPLEDNIRGTQDKQMVCIFCTTEPEKMRSAILSRCAPLFRIRQNTPEEIANRLEVICKKENLAYDKDALVLIAEVCECHIRDSIKAVEGISMLGAVDKKNVFSYLQMDANSLYLDILENIGFSLEKVLQAAEALDTKTSPATRYEKMADICMLAYRLVNFGAATVPSYWEKDRIQKIGEAHKEFLVEFAKCFSARPVHATNSMFLCDVSALHQKRAGVVVVASKQEVSVVSSEIPTISADSPVSPTLSEAETSEVQVHIEDTNSSDLEVKKTSDTSQKNEHTLDKNAETSGTVSKDPIVTSMGVHINPLAQNTHRNTTDKQVTVLGLPSLGTEEFARILQRRVIELTEEQSSSGRPARFNDLGSS